MAKKPTKKPKPKRVEIVLPVGSDQPLPEEVVVVPVAMERVEVAPLLEVAGPVPCVIAIRHAFWSGENYVVLAAEPGHALPDGLTTGQRVEVLFCPPGQTASGSRLTGN